MKGGYPGLTAERRVVLDLTFRGYGLSSEIVNTQSELLAIADPAARFDPVPGAVVARVELGIGLAKLIKAGARFDLIVCDLPPDSQCAAVGAFSPHPAPLATSGRRILGCAPPAPKPALSTGLAPAAWTAINALLADRGEALVRMHGADFWGAAHPKHVWWRHEQESHVDLYLKRGARALDVRRSLRAPGAADRYNACGPEVWTPGQRQSFKETLLG